MQTIEVVGLLEFSDSGTFLIDTLFIFRGDFFAMSKSGSSNSVDKAKDSKADSAKPGSDSSVNGSASDQSSGGEKQLPKEGSILEWVRAGVFPKDWNLIPVAGKATYVKEWCTTKRRQVDAEGLFFEDSRYKGFGVVTGALSGGLIALDIDGPEADKRYKAA